MRVGAVAADGLSPASARLPMQGAYRQSARAARALVTRLLHAERLSTAARSRVGNLVDGRLPSGGAPQRPTFRLFSSGGGGGGNGGGGSSGGGGGSGGSGRSGSIWAAYLALLDRYPLPTKAVTAALLNGLGDVIAQLNFNDKDAPFNWRRLGVFTGLGLVMIGPALHFWYGTLGRLITAQGTKGAALRMAVDQLAFAPVFISLIVSSIMALEGHAGDVPAKLRADLPTMVRSNWTLWVPFQFVNFRYVPPQLQVLASNTVALAWNAYMSWISHRTA